MTGIYYDLERAQEVAGIPETLADVIGIPYENWTGKCHEVSKRLLDTDLFGPGRIARGWALGVRDQHSWIVLAEDVYDPDAVVVDPTIWHNRLGHPHKGILVAIQWEIDTHHPHGEGSILQHAKPARGDGPVIELTPGFRLSEEARSFLKLLGPLDYRGWMQLANGPMQGWPAGEIIAAMDDTKLLRAAVPIDILGMVTRRNPMGRYLQDLSAMRGRK
jgi:hypothetical protein